MSSKEEGMATARSECLDVGERLGMVRDEVDDQFSLV